VVRDQSKVNVFISYSRKDMAFADRLDAALTQRGFDTKIDREEVYAFERWWDRIRSLITEADTVVFVLSPHAVASEVCAKEVEFAAALNKRFAPIVCRRVADDAVPQALRELNFIYFEDEERFEHGMAELAEALVTNIDWVRKHTEYGALAQRWTASGASGLLLRTPVLEEAERWIASRPANAPSPTEATQAFIAESRRAATRRRSILSVSLATGLVVAIGLATVALWQRGLAVSNEQRAIAGEDLARQNERQAQAERDRVLLTQSRFLGDLANQRIKDSDPASGILLALEALPDERDGVRRPYSPEAESTLFTGRQQLRELRLLKGHTDSLSKARYSPDGARVLTASGDKTARIWDVTSGKEMVALKGHEEAVNDATFSPDGKRVVTASSDKTARIWDAATGQPIVVLNGHERRLHGAAFSPDGERVVTAGGQRWSGDFFDTTARIWDAQTGKQILVLEGHKESVRSATFSPDGTLVATTSGEANGSEEKTARIWDAATGRQLAVLEGHGAMVTSAAFSPDGSRLVTSSFDDTARVWDVATGKELLVLKGHRRPLNSAAFSPDGARIVTASNDRTMRIWDATTGKELDVFNGHEGPVTSAGFSPDGTRVVTSSGLPTALDQFKDNTVLNLRDSTARIWDVAHRAELAVIQPGGELANAALSPDSRRVVTVADGQQARIWDATTGTKVADIRGHEAKVNTAAFSPDARLVITASEDKTARIWDAKSGKELGVLKGHEKALQYAAFSPDGSRAVTGSFDETARLWDVASGKELLVLKNQATGSVVAFSPNGRRLLTSSDKLAALWDAETGKQIALLKGHTTPVNSGAFSPDGSLVVTASGVTVLSGPSTARLWNGVTGDEIAEFKHPGAVHSAAFSPDGTRLVTASGTFTGQDIVAHIWDVPTHDEITALKGHSQAVASAAFSPDGTRVITGSFDKTAAVWDLATSKRVAVLKGHEAALKTAMLGSDGLRAMTTSYDNTVRTWLVFPTTQSLVDDAKQAVPRCLTETQRAMAFLDPEPPAWCIRLEKWPYHTQAWKDWLRLKHAGEKPSLPRSLH
jgi:WD40 repeat protein